MANRPSKDKALFEHLIRREDIMQKVVEIRNYIKLDEFKSKYKNKISVENFDRFLESNKILRKYFPSKIEQTGFESDFQNYNECVNFLLEEFKLPDIYFKILKYILAELKLESDFYDSSKFIISYTKVLDEALQRYEEQLKGDCIKYKDEPLWSPDHNLIKEQYYSFKEEDDNNFPIAIKMTPFVKQEEFVKFIRENWDYITEIQDKYKKEFDTTAESIRGKKEITQLEADLIMNYHSQGLNSSEIRAKLSKPYADGDEYLLREPKVRDIIKVVKNETKKRHKK